MADILDSAQKNTDGIVVSPPEAEPANIAHSTPISALEVPVTPPPQQTTTAMPTKSVVNPITGNSSMVTSPKVDPTPKPSKSQLTPNEPTSFLEPTKHDALIVPPKNSPPPEDNNSSYISSKGKPKLGPVIAGLLLLLLTLPIAIYYVSQQNHQQQDIRSNAMYATAAPTSGSSSSIGAPGTKEAQGTFGTLPDGTVAGKQQWEDTSLSIAGTYISSGQRFLVALPDTYDAAVKFAVANPGVEVVANPEAKLGADGLLPTVAFPSAIPTALGGMPDMTWVPPGTGCDPTVPTSIACTSWHWTTCASGNSGLNTIGCVPSSSKGGGGNNNGSTNTPTPTPIPTSACTAIQVFKNSTQLDAAGLAALQPGDAVVVKVAGANASKAHIRVNGGAWQESTTLDTGFYIFNYTIPSGITNFTIESEVFGSDGNWH